MCGASCDAAQLINAGFQLIDSGRARVAEVVSSSGVKAEPKAMLEVDALRN